MKTKNLNSPWITKRIKKSSRKKQRLYEKFLQNKTTKRLANYKQYYKTFIWKIRKRSKKLYLEKKLQKYENGIKTTWKIIK